MVGGKMEKKSCQGKTVNPVREIKEKKDQQTPEMEICKKIFKILFSFFLKN